MDFVGTAWLGYISDVQASCLTDTGQEIGLNHYIAKMKKLLKKKIEFALACGFPPTVRTRKFEPCRPEGSGIPFFSKRWC